MLEFVMLSPHHLKIVLLFQLQLNVCMHSVNAVFLLGDTILNCLVSLIPLCCWWLFISNSFVFNASITNLQLSFPSSVFPCFGLHILFYGRVYLSFFSGSSMLAFQCGKVIFPVCPFIYLG